MLEADKREILDHLRGRTIGKYVSGSRWETLELGTEMTAARLAGIMQAAGLSETPVGDPAWEQIRREHLREVWS